MCKVSIIMSVYNTPEKWLREAIDSILKQSFRDFEFIIITDCPTDNSGNIVEDYAQKDKRIRIINNEKNLGLTRSLNKGLSVAGGEYIARMDSDDISCRNRLEKQIAYMDNHKDVTVLGANIDVFDMDGNHYLGMNNNSNSKEITAIRMLFCNAGVVHSTAILRKTFLDEHQIKYNERIKKAQDYALWKDIVIAGGKIEVMEDILVRYRIHSGQITNQCSEEQISCIKEIMSSQYKYYFNLDIDDNERNLNFAFYRDIDSVDVVDLEKFIRKIIQTNRIKRVFNKKLFEREILSIWLYSAIVDIVKHKRTGFCRSALFAKSLSPAVITYTFKKRYADKKLLWKVKEFQNRSVE